MNQEIQPLFEVDAMKAALAPKPRGPKPDLAKAESRRHPTPPAVPVQVGINLPKPALRTRRTAASTVNPPQLVSQSC